MRSMVEGAMPEAPLSEVFPLHHPSGGPPPPTGEERGRAQRTLYSWLIWMS